MKKVVVSVLSGLVSLAALFSADAAIQTLRKQDTWPQALLKLNESLAYLDAKFAGVLPDSITSAMIIDGQVRTNDLEASFVAGIRASSNKADTAYGWGNHATAGYATVTGFTMSGSLNMGGEKILGLSGRSIDFDQGEIYGDFSFFGTVTLPDYLTVADAADDYYPMTGGPLLGGIALTSGDLVVTNTAGGQVRLSPTNPKGILTGASNGVTTVQFRPENPEETLWLRGGSIRLVDFAGTTSLTVNSSGIYDIDGNLLLDRYGKLSLTRAGQTTEVHAVRTDDFQQSPSGVSILGVVQASSLNAGSLTGTVPAGVISASGIGTAVSVSGLAVAVTSLEARVTGHDAYTGFVARAITDGVYTVTVMGHTGTYGQLTAGRSLFTNGVAVAGGLAVDRLSAGSVAATNLDAATVSSEYGFFDTRTNWFVGDLDTYRLPSGGPYTATNQFSVHFGAVLGNGTGIYFGTPTSVVAALCGGFQAGDYRVELTLTHVPYGGGLTSLAVSVFENGFASEASATAAPALIGGYPNTRIVSASSVSETPVSSISLSVTQEWTAAAGFTNLYISPFVYNAPGSVNLTQTNYPGPVLTRFVLRRLRGVHVNPDGVTLYGGVLRWVGPDGVVRAQISANGSQFGSSSFFVDSTGNALMSNGFLWVNGAITAGTLRVTNAFSAPYVSAGSVTAASLAVASRPSVLGTNVALVTDTAPAADTAYGLGAASFRGATNDNDVLVYRDGGIEAVSPTNLAGGVVTWSAIDTNSNGLVDHAETAGFSARSQSSANADTAQVAVTAGLADVAKVAATSAWAATAGSASTSQVARSAHTSVWAVTAGSAESSVIAAAASNAYAIRNVAVPAMASSNDEQILVYDHDTASVKLVPQDDETRVSLPVWQEWATSVIHRISGSPPTNPVAGSIEQVYVEEAKTNVYFFVPDAFGVNTHGWIRIQGVLIK